MSIKQYSTLLTAHSLTAHSLTAHCYLPPRLFPPHSSEFDLRAFRLEGHQAAVHLTALEGRGLFAVDAHRRRAAGEPHLDNVPLPGRLGEAWRGLHLDEFLAVTAANNRRGDCAAILAQSHLAAICVDCLADEKARAVRHFLSPVRHEPVFDSQRPVSELPFRDVDFVCGRADQNAVAPELPRRRPVARSGPVAQVAAK